MRPPQAEDEWEPSEREWDDASKRSVVAHLVGCYEMGEAAAKLCAAKGPNGDAGDGEDPDAPGAGGRLAWPPLAELLDWHLPEFTRRFSERVDIDTQLADEMGVWSSHQAEACELV